MAGMTVLQFFGQVGISILLDVVDILCETLFWGIFAVLAVIVACMVLRKGLKSRFNLAMLVATIIMFTSASIHLALDVFAAVVFIRGALIDQSTPNLNSRLMAVAKITSSFGFTFSAMINSVINFTLSDMIVVWRAWTLCSENRKMMVGPLLALFGSTATIIASIGVDIEVISTGNRRLSAVTGALQYTSWVLSLATNFATTSLIGYKAWQHRQFIEESLGQGNSRTRVEKIMALLVESGGLYCIFWIILLFSQYIPFTIFGSLNYVANLILPTFVQLAGIYPTVILVLVSLEKTIWDSRGSVVGSIGGSNTHMEFAPGPGIISKTTASRHQISVIQLDTEMQAVEFERDHNRDLIKASV